jgi:hypothetical protein
VQFKTKTKNQKPKTQNPKPKTNPAALHFPEVFRSASTSGFRYGSRAKQPTLQHFTSLKYFAPLQLQGSVTAASLAFA